MNHSRDLIEHPRQEYVRLLDVWLELDHTQKPRGRVIKAPQGLIRDAQRQFDLRALVEAGVRLFEKLCRVYETAGAQIELAQLGMRLFGRRKIPPRAVSIRTGASLRIGRHNRPRQSVALGLG